MASGAGTSRRRQRRGTRAPRRPASIARQRSLLARVLSVLAILGLGAGLYMLLDSPIFLANRVLVSGNQIVSTDTIRAAANTGGRNIFMLSSQEIADRVQQIPQIQRVEATLRAPSTVIIRVYERPTAYTWRSGDRVYPLSAEGIVLSEGEPEDSRGTIVDLTNKPIQPGDRIAEELLKASERLTNWLPGRTGLQVERFEHSPTDGLVVVTSEGYRVLFGNAENLGLRLGELQTVLDQLARSGRKASVIDLRNEGQPVAR